MAVAAARAMFNQGGDAPAAPGRPGSAASSGAKSADYFTLKLDDITKRPSAISCCALNKDGTELAFSPNSNEVVISKFVNGTWQIQTVLKEHDQKVTSIDWAPETNRILSCSEDRNAYVWDFSPSTGWKPTLVLLRINRAATYAKWSRNEKKFAVASGQKCCAICYYEEENNWWVSKHVEGFDSTVLTVSWHSSDIVLAAGSSDGTVRLFTAAVKGVDSKPSQMFGPDVSFKKLGTEICCIKTNAWVHDMDFSPSGELLAYVTHDSSLHILPVRPGAPPAQESVSTIKCRGLPMQRLMFVAEDSVVAGGHDCNPTMFAVKAGAWAEGKKLDDAKAEKKGFSAGASARSAAFKKFEMSSTQGVDSTAPSEASTLHQNCISGVASCQAWKAGGRVSKIVTVGLDGRLCFWQIPGLSEAFAAASIN